MPSRPRGIGERDRCVIEPALARAIARLGKDPREFGLEGEA